MFPFLCVSVFLFWHISNIRWHRIHITIAKSGEQGIVRKYWTQTWPNPSTVNSKSLTLCLLSKGRWLFPSSLADFTTLLLDWLLSLSGVLFGRYSTILLSLTSWSLQCNQRFSFRASGNGLSWPPCRDFPTMQPCNLNDSRHSLSEERDSKPLYSRNLHDPKLHDPCCLLEMELCLELHLPKLWFVVAF